MTMNAPHPTGKADLHTHSRASDGLGTIEAMLDFAEHRAHLDILCISDHDDLSPSLFARDLSAQRGYHCAVVPGMEITTLSGHLLALYLEEQVPSMRPLATTIEAVHRQGGVCVVPHPMSWLTYSIGRAQLDAASGGGRPELMPDALELENPTPAGRVTQKAARKANRDNYALAEVGGSDAHFVQSIGTAYTTFPGQTPSDLRTAISNRATQAHVIPRHERPRVGPVTLARQTFRALVLHPRKLVKRVVLQIMKSP